MDEYAVLGRIGTYLKYEIQSSMPTLFPIVAFRRYN